MRSSPAVRRLARRFAITLEALQGSGRGGRVTRDDVLREVDRTADARSTGRRTRTPGAPRPPAVPAGSLTDLSLASEVLARPTPSTPPPVARAEAMPFPTRLPIPAEALGTGLPTPIADDDEAPIRAKRAPAYRPPSYQPQPSDRVVPFSRRREQIAGHMVHSLHTAAHVFALGEIDMSRVMAAKTADAPHAERSGLKLTFMPYVVAAVARALAEHPELNATVVGDSLVLRGERNLGVAVDTEEGLVVPVVRRADELGLIGITRAIQELSERARQGKLTPTDLSGGSFTISNPGKDGNLYGVSIIRQPEVAILRMGSIVKRPVVREIEGEDVIVVRPMMYAALSYDHRVIDGRKGNGFLTRLTQLLAAQRPVLAS